MKILLVIPPAPYMTDDRAFPPLGILYVCAFLKKHGKKVQVLDLAGEKKWKEKFAAALNKIKPAYIGFTATTPDMPSVFSLLKIARKKASLAKTVIGGAHATIAAEECASLFDSVVVGDGLDSSLKAFSSCGGGIIRSPLLKDLSALPLPDREAIDLKKYNYEIEGRKAANIMSHLGCPFKCVFCCGRKTSYYTSVRFRPVESVAAEMAMLEKKYGYKAFVFYDDEFNLSKNYAIKLCSTIEKRGYLWRAPVRADLLDEKLAMAMKKAGCVEVTVGVESGSEKVLKMAGKMTTPEINSRAREICKKTGIRFKAFVIVGLPFSSEKDERMTERWLIENRPDSIDININTPYPSTIEYEERKKYGLKFDFDFLRQRVSYKFDPGKYRAFCCNSFLSPQKMIEIRRDMLKRVKKVLT